MKTLKRIGKVLLFPHIAFVIILAPIAAALLIYSFAYENVEPYISYASYFLSAYALTIVCARAPEIYKKAKQFRDNNRYITTYRSDAGLRVRISLYRSWGLNLAYALMQLVLGIINRSVWFYALAGYYFMLVVMRFFLLREARYKRLGEDLRFELLLYRLCGALLVAMNLSLVGIVFYIVRRNYGFEYHYIVTIAMAAYTFFTLTMAIVNIVRYRKYKSPVMSASKIISLAAALVSLLSLETAMLTAFGEGNDALLRQIMTACTGAAVCIAVLAMASYMIISSTKQINALKGETNGK